MAVALGVLATLPARSGLLIDLGCGPGALLERVTGSRLGIDRSRQDLRALGARAPEVRRVEADLNEALPLGDASADVCVMLDALPYLDSPREFLAEVRRVVRAGGYFVVSVPNARQITRLWTLARGRTISLSRLEAPYERGQRHLFSDRSLRDLLEQGGFACESLRGLLPSPGSLPRRIASRAARAGVGRAWLAPGVLAVGRRR